MTKKIIKTICFILILAAALVWACCVFSIDEQLNTKVVFEDFYAHEDNTIDVVYFGTSATQRGWITPVAYDEYGIASYSLATASQPFCLTKSLIEEVNKTQSPRVYIVDLRNLTVSPNEIADSHIRRVTDSMKNSANRYRAVNAALDFASQGDNGIDVTDKSYYIPLMKYHILWNRGLISKKADLKYLEGFAYYEKSYYKIVPKEDCGIVTQENTFNKPAEKVLNDLLDYCDGLDAEILFVVSPCPADTDKVAAWNYAERMVTERGYKVLNFFDKEVREAIYYDSNKFYYDDSHMNYYGAMQYTQYLSKYLKDNYELPNRKESGEVYSCWQKSYDKLIEFTGDKYEKMIQSLN